MPGWWCDCPNTWSHWFTIAMIGFAAMAGDRFLLLAALKAVFLCP